MTLSLQVLAVYVTWSEQQLRWVKQRYLVIVCPDVTLHCRTVVFHYQSTMYLSFKSNVT